MTRPGAEISNRGAPADRKALRKRWAARDARYAGRYPHPDILPFVRAWRETEAMEIGDLELAAEALRWPAR